MAKPRLLITRRIPDETLARVSPRFELDHHDKPTAIPRRGLLKRVARADALLCLLTEKIDAELLAAAPRLKMVGTISVGLDHVDLKACSARRIPVAYTPGILTETCADFTWALLLAAARRVVEGDRAMRAGKYKGWDLMMLLGTDVHGKTLGLLGFGRIGQAVARRAAGFGMRVLAYDKVPPPPEVWRELNVEPAAFERVLSESDFLSIHTVLDASTRHLIGEPELKKMRRSAYLVNSARGPIVDEKALVKALREGWIRGAALDVYENEPRVAPGLSRLPNAVIAPHLASASVETRTGMANLAAGALIDWLLEGRRPSNVANPEAFAQRAAA